MAFHLLIIIWNFNRKIMATNRRDFMRNLTYGAVGVGISGISSGFTAKSYNRIIGANERLNVALMGCGRRVGIVL